MRDLIKDHYRDTKGSHFLGMPNEKQTHHTEIDTKAMYMSSTFTKMYILQKNLWKSELPACTISTQPAWYKKNSRTEFNWVVADG